ncbi:MAG: lysine 2,3-aminomutase, partial [Thermotogota bacterium]
MTEKQKNSIWGNCTPEEWNDWKWQLKNRIMDVETLNKVIKLTEEDKRAIEHSLGFLRMAITPY